MRSLRQTFSWSLAGNVVYVACQWAILVLLAKLLDPEAVGRFALGLAIAAPVMLFANLALRTVLVTAGEGYAFQDYLGLRLITSVLGLMTIGVIVVTMGYSGSSLIVIAAVSLAKAVEAISDIIYGLLQRHEHLDVIAKSMISKGVLSVICATIALWLLGSALSAALALVLAWTAVLVFYDVPQGVQRLREHQTAKASVVMEVGPLLRPQFSVETLKPLAILAVPLGATTMLASLSANIPRYVIERAQGERELGLYAALAYLMVASNTVIGALAQSALPRLSKAYAGDRVDEFRTLGLKLVSCGAAIGVAGIVISVVAGRPILEFIYGPEYAAHSDVLVVLSIATGVGAVGWVLSYLLSAIGLFTPQMKINAGVAAIVLIASIALVPRHGLVGAALAVCIAISFQVVALSAAVWRTIFRSGPVPPGHAKGTEAFVPS